MSRAVSPETLLAASGGRCARCTCEVAQFAGEARARNVEQAVLWNGAAWCSACVEDAQRASKAERRAAVRRSDVYKGEAEARALAAAGLKVGSAVALWCPSWTGLGGAMLRGTVVLRRKVRIYVRLEANVVTSKREVPWDARWKAPAQA